MAGNNAGRKRKFKMFTKLVEWGNTPYAYNVLILKNGEAVIQLTKTFYSKTEAFAYAEALEMPYQLGSLR